MVIDDIGLHFRGISFLKLLPKEKPLRSVVIALAAVLTSSLAAHADTLTYDLTSSFSDGGTVTGTLALDNATGLFTAANLVAKGFPISNGTYTSILYQGPDLINGTDLDVVDYTYGSEDEFDFDPTNFVGYNAKTIGVDSFYFNSGLVFDNSFSQSASLTLQQTVTPPSTTVTPEPSSIALLGTGVLGIAGVLRKRFV